MSVPLQTTKRSLSWLIPRQRVLFGLIVFLVASFFIRTFFFVANSPTRLHELQKLLPTSAMGSSAPETRNLDQPKQEEQKGGDLIPALVPKFVQFRQNYRLSEKHKIEVCVIDGNLENVFTGVMCFIHDPAKYKEANRTIYNETLENRLCKDQNEADKFHVTPQQPNKTEENHKQKWIHLAAVRDPVERFVSSFNRLCVQKPPNALCGSCAENFTCFLQMQHERAVQYGKNSTSFKLNDADKEFFPQNWHCDFFKYLNNYTLLRIESKDEGNTKLFNDLYFKCRDQDVNNDDMTFIYKQINEPPQTSENKAVEESILESQLRIDVHAMQLLMQLYYHDFQLFGFELPYIEEKN